MLKIVLDAPMKYLWGNLTYFAQLPLGVFCFSDGGASAIDAVSCVNPLAKPLFVTGAVANLGSGTCMLASFGLGYICLTAALAVGGLGTGLRRVGRYAVSSANLLEPKPTLTKTTALAGKIVDALDDPLSLII